MYELYIINSALELMGDERDDTILLNEIRYAADEIIKFEIRLNEIISANENNDNLTDIYQTIKISHLQHLTDLTSTRNGEKV